MILYDDGRIDDLVKNVDLVKHEVSELLLEFADYSFSELKNVGMIYQPQRIFEIGYTLGEKQKDVIVYEYDMDIFVFTDTMESVLERLSLEFLNMDYEHYAKLETLIENAKTVEDLSSIKYVPPKWERKFSDKMKDLSGGDEDDIRDKFRSLIKK